MKLQRAGHNWVTNTLTFPYRLLQSIVVEFLLLYSCSLLGEGNGNPLQYSCLGNPMDRGAWWALVHGVVKSWVRLRDFPFTFHFHALEKKMAPYSSVLAWRIPATVEPGGLPSMGSHSVRHDWRDLTAAAAPCWATNIHWDNSQS